MSKPSFLPFCICLLLIVLVFAVYGKAIENGFVHYDDYMYVIDNEQIQKGFTFDSIRWAFEINLSNWHPLTWLSHMLDYLFFGLDPKGHHLSSVLLHLTNTVLLFFLLRFVTGTLWRSAFVAALFGVHPLHVESVAWIAERKDVLSGLFWIITTWFYVWYAENPVPRRYFLVLLWFSLGLMAKPMLVTLPFVLLLLDFWPLGRLRRTNSKWPLKSITKLIVEKFPLFALTVISSTITMYAQGRARSLLDLDTRIANALVSYVAYLMKTVWPTNLAVFYPHPINTLPIWKTVGAAILLVGVTFFATWKWRRYPYLAVGWLWYLGTLVPVIGVVQVGAQAMADRYTYIPLIGFFIVVSWGINDLFDYCSFPKPFKMLFAVSMIFPSLMVASSQVRHWQNTRTLFEHAIKSTPNNYIAHAQLGAFLNRNGKTEEAAGHFAEAVRIKPDYATARFNLGNALSQLGKLEEAILNYSITVQTEPVYWKAYINMGLMLSHQRKYDEAANALKKALEIHPGSGSAHNSLGVISIKQGKYNEAITRFTKAIEIKPGLADVHNNMGLALVGLGKQDEAAQYYIKAIELKPGLAEPHFNLANILAGQGKLRDAVVHYSQAIESDAEMTEAYHNLGVALVKLGKLREAAGFFKNALKLEPGFGPSRRAFEELQSVLKN